MMFRFPSLPSLPEPTLVLSPFPSCHIPLFTRVKPPAPFSPCPDFIQAYLRFSSSTHFLSLILYQLLPPQFLHFTVIWTPCMQVPPSVFASTLNLSFLREQRETPPLTEESLFSYRTYPLIMWSTLSGANHH